ncbi:MAG: peptide chain release factor N(5)-glutamine methyltransferase [Bryobacteraceae bacterium]|nr:peptide chain release factor N(5)-glutamine methyltransferase [Bryobacteraceae bacterium]
MTLRTALEQGTSILSDATISVPRLTAEVLLCHALGRERVWLYAHANDELSEIGWIHYGRYLYQRTTGRPTQYITGRQEFYGRDFRVSSAVLIPRPETEHVVTQVLRHIRQGSRVLDVGTGSGAIAVSVLLEAPGAIVFASDVSPQALALAVVNSATHGAQVRFFLADLTAAVANASLDVVVSNPPYIGYEESAGLATEVREHEPHLALFADEDGLEVYRRLILDASRVLKPGGWLVLELGHSSLGPVQSFLDPAIWSLPVVTPDLAGIPRVLAAARRPSEE